MSAPPLSAEFDAMFDGIQNAKESRPPRTPRLPEGTHIVILKEYGPKKSSKPGSTKKWVQASFMLEESRTQTTAKAGESFDWLWFPASEDWLGEKERERGKQFIDTVAATLSDARPNKMVATDAVAHKFRGMRIQVKITPARNNKTGQLVIGSKGQIFDAEWSVVPGQTMELIKEMGAALDKIDPLKPAAPASQQQYQAPAPQYQAPPAAYAPPAPPQYAQAPAPAYQPPPPAYAAPAPQYQAPPVAAPAYAPPPAPAAPVGGLPPFLANLPKVG